MCLRLDVLNFETTKREGIAPTASQGRDETYGQAPVDEFLTGPRPPDLRNEQTGSHHFHMERGTLTSSQRNSTLFAVSMVPTGNGTARARD